MYAPLREYLLGEMGMVSKRIRESTSANRRSKGGNKWLHPDLVGMLAPSQHWERIVRDCSSQIPTRKAKLVGVEVKTRLTASSVRESFFQAVSNSSWANLAYLAATEIAGTDTLSELQTLSALHGVGFLRIDPENPAEGQVLIPAREREEVDWASANRIAAENADFRSFLKNVLNYLQSGEIVHSMWS